MDRFDTETGGLESMRDELVGIRLRAAQTKVFILTGTLPESN